MAADVFQRLVVLRGVIGGLAIICFYITIVKLGAGRAIVINLTYPMFATVIAAFWLKEKGRVATRWWLVVALAGLVIFLSDENLGVAPSAYDLLGFFGAVTAGWVVVIIRKLRHTEHPTTIYGAQASLLAASWITLRLESPGTAVRRMGSAGAGCGGRHIFATNHDQCLPAD